LRAAADFLRVLGDPDAPALDIPALLADHDLSPDFPSPVLDAARSAAVPADPARRDLRAECILTIDPHDARDYDDAVSAAPLPAGGWRIAVHIADVAAFVPPDSSVDLEARRRGNTTYLVDRTIRMLPEDLTVRVCSLQPNEDHLAHTVEFTVAADGSVTPGPTYRSLIRSRACLSYDEVQAHFDGAPHPARADTPDLRAALSALRAASAAMRRRRFLDGALDFSLPEVHCTLDPSGNPLSFEKRRAPEAYALIEECMLAANRAVAQKLDAASFPAPWRVHPQPEPDQWTRMAAELRALGVPGPAPATSDDLNRIARAVADSPLRYIVTLTLLRNLQRAVYSPSAAPHFGLGFRRYLHFTSPIRRYPDLVAHRLLTALEDGLPPPVAAADVAELARYCSATEKESADMEAESLLVKRIRYYASLLARGENGPWTGTIIALNPKGLVVELVDTLQTGLLPYSALGRERFTLAPDDYVATSTRGSQYRLGQTVDVSISAIDEKTRRIDFYLPSLPPRPPRPAQKPSPKPAKNRPRKKHH
jgi:ribonuclease R